MLNRKKSYICIALSCFLLLTTGCKKEDTKQNPSSKIQMYTSIYPLEDFAKKIGGSHVDVMNLVPPGTEPHDFELTAKELVKLSTADAFIYNGAGLESWIDQAKVALDTKKTVLVDTSQGLVLSSRNGREDPHIWLDPNLAKAQALKIKAAFIQVDPKHQAEYEKNYQQLEMKFVQLDREYQDMIKTTSRREFVVSHAAFHYLAKRYHLHQIAVSGISPLDEPSPRELQRLIQIMKKNHMHYIFFETLVSNKLANVIKNEVDAEALILNPLEGLTEEELAQGADYFSIMRKNKEHLTQALSGK